MILSRASEYGIQTLLHLITQPQERYVPVHEIADDRGISSSFLAKIARQLVDHGLLESQKGPGGGVRLASSPTRIRLLDVVEAVDGTELFTRCVIGYPGCGEGEPCPLHETWGPLRDDISRMLSAKSLGDFAREMGEGAGKQRTSRKKSRSRRSR